MTERLVQEEIETQKERGKKKTEIKEYDQINMKKTVEKKKGTDMYTSLINSKSLMLSFILLSGLLTRQ